jgi:hypothetical protein
MTENPYRILYEFQFPDGSSKRFTIHFDRRSFSMIHSTFARKPEWTLLNHHKCACCTLQEAEYPHCPVSQNIAGLVEEFKDSLSSDSCIVRCTTEERTYLKRVAIQEGLFSLFGLIMSTSDCPILSFFRPMARFHMPFASAEETIFRVSSIYLLRQYFEYKQDQPPDLDLNGLHAHYERVQIVNRTMLSRIKCVVGKDADRNAITILNAFAQLFSIEYSDDLSSLEFLFLDN